MRMEKRVVPELVLDDLGIFHELEVPLPASYKRLPCKCGIVHKWEEPDTFELYPVEMVENGDLLGFPRKTVKRCKTCLDILLLGKKDIDFFKDWTDEEQDLFFKKQALLRAINGQPKS